MPSGSTRCSAVSAPTRGATGASRVVLPNASAEAAGNSIKASAAAVAAFSVVMSAPSDDIRESLDDDGRRPGHPVDRHGDRGHARPDGLHDSAAADGGDGGIRAAVPHVGGGEVDEGLVVG